ncbi:MULTISPECIES: enoyl-CoA hydratase-related protein [unclassified Polaromonas]|jgi:enoyl-CoA hydratase|uniref:enoyl-CoA hydratase-related protein n=1 Tax=unclassified Polaromonas TaxID=2638319 RepID=UPI000BD8E139|nr:MULTISPECIES: enoyl-CoA hydratase-related protein [unclassified Polaromonas]OYY36493.1 MAG: enoyl-CoA hydratase [Polaromonas sp. 35-63-35]OYZ22728.1 MAG: enoyl-CoA hydratase [Polaromonas sp. 16-63-31]OYZ81059.1 MAG: enoyl-CoA hydratase [Polaromonas sp. 24-63-21]OZA52722.1 MAG: enoyl-CoA hydratase [Polaromonas sp. 17-63-33]OZA88423.1 MAG: enoyl-CoA hydratase [Polaromonas sp. 39-63-25]
MNPLTCFTLSTTDHIAHLVLNRPEAMNTMHPTFWRELDEVLTHIHKAGDARVLVISSTGKHFSAGMALETFSGAIAMDDQSPEGRAAIFDMLADMQATFTKLETLRIPVIAAIQGGCIGGAVDMVTACCLRYATSDAFFCIQEINIGMVADVGTLQRLPKLVPLAVVKELAYTGRRLGAARALGYGLVNEVFDSPEALLAGALLCAKEIASKPPVAIWGTKQAIHYTRDHSVDDALKQMGWLQGAIWSNQHVREAVTAMKEKRAGGFAGLSPLQSFKEIGL